MWWRCHTSEERRWRFIGLLRVHVLDLQWIAAVRVLCFLILDRTAEFWEIITPYRQLFILILKAQILGIYLSTEGWLSG